MTGAIFYTTRYGSTAQYARWIAEATDLPAFDAKADGANPATFGFLVLGSPVIYHRLSIGKWARRHLPTLLDRPVILFSVSGAGPGPKLDGWIQASLPAELIAHADHVALLGRQSPDALTLFDRMMLIIGGLMNPDPKASNEEMKGFDFMDKASIGPVVDRIIALKTLTA